MTAIEFAAWLEGFLDNRDTITDEDKVKIVTKAGRVKQPTYTMPYPPGSPLNPWKIPGTYYTTTS